MLTEMARRADQLTRNLERQFETRVAPVEPDFIDMPFGDAVVGPSPHLPGQGARQVVREAQRLSDLADRPSGPITADHGCERGMLMAIGFVDPLDHFLAPFMLEIDIDVGRLIPAFRSEEHTSE